MNKISEFDTVRTIVPLRGANVFNDDDIVDLPVGSIGTVVDLLGNRGGYEVEFLLGPADALVSVELTLTMQEMELAQKAPRH